MPESDSQAVQSFSSKQQRPFRAISQRRIMVVFLKDEVEMGDKLNAHV